MVSHSFQVSVRYEHVLDFFTILSKNEILKYKKNVISDLKAPKNSNFEVTKNIRKLNSKILFYDAKICNFLSLIIAKKLDTRANGHCVKKKSHFVL